ncbi:MULTISPECIES: DUF6932 family protein [Enterobacteriaceae]|uniref:Uncharacterized protein n=2 Tax=Enterobacter cloacae complex TaxID=354276 RepID=A0A6S5JSB7_ENTCL|nr:MULTISPECIES: hypothetical protein [Enterobacteriaceae]HEM6697978.1 hypothetical protein [Citrobacter amalonaticus]ELK6103814.1 hypothetical protein [Citrobacter freundii]KLV54592.1 hypothetical protein SK34_03303 [Citrobacter sp. MGH104]MBJ9132676.1 hypothetical protein [Citrobacter freundii]MCK7373669.1 hypothetical protein [Enterobacter bugandensis]
MTTLTTPLWNSMGVIPPIDEADPTSHARSPYVMDIVNFVNMFALTATRRKILKGFLAYRSCLSQVGLTDGFQWVDGSFTENIELTERRAPNDVDVVTFFKFLPGDDDSSVINRNPDLFDHEYVKKNYLVDSYYEGLDAPGHYLVDRTVYWYSMWAHKRDLSWKGFIQIPLNPQLDVVALTILNASEAEEGNNES